MTRRVALMVHPSSELYGSDRVFVESARALIDDGWQVVVALPHQGPLTAELRRCGVEVVQCRTPVLRKANLRPRGFLRLLVECVAAVTPMVRLLVGVRPDVVYVNTVTVPLWPVLARVLGYRVVGHVHEAEDSVPGIVRAALAAPLLACTTVVANSRATASVIERSLSRLRHRTSLVYNGVPGPHDVFEADQDAFLADAVSRGDGAAPDPARVVLIGRLSPRKGSDVAVAAVSWLARNGRTVSLQLVGSAFAGYEWYEQQLSELIRERGLDAAVRLHGFHSNVWDALADADIAVVPSRFEPFGNTAVEAQLAGVPVVVTDVQGLPETVDHGRRGSIVASDDPAALGEEIARLLDDWPQTLEVAERARKEAAELFAPERYHRDIARIMARVSKRRAC